MLTMQALDLEEQNQLLSLLHLVLSQVLPSTKHEGNGQHPLFARDNVDLPD